MPIWQKADGLRNLQCHFGKRLLPLKFAINRANTDAEKLSSPSLVTLGELESCLNYASFNFVHWGAEWDSETLAFFKLTAVNSSELVHINKCAR